MRTRRFRILFPLFALLLSAGLALAPNSVRAQPRAYSQAELDSLLAPIALYPDPLLSQVLMAATYPLEVIAAASWARDHPGLQGDAAVRAAQAQDWDPSVKSLLAFPNLLRRMDENRGWTRDLGAAFIAQEPQVMDTIQMLRHRARAAGNLVPDARTRLVEIDRAIVIEPVDPQLVYLPYYDPRVVYGTWWWPAHPPVAWAPWPGYLVQRQYPGIAAAWFWGPAIRVSLGFFFGAPDWRHRHLRVAMPPERYYASPMREPTATFTPRPPGQGAHSGRWQHVPAHRPRAGYRRVEIRTRLAPVREPRPLRPRQEIRRDIAAPAPVFRAPRAPVRVETPRALPSPPALRAHPRRGTERRIAAPPRAGTPRVHTPSPGPGRDRRSETTGPFRASRGETSRAQPRALMRPRATSSDRTGIRR